MNVRPDYHQPAVGSRLALGIERLGLIPMRHRWPSLAVVVVLAVAAVFGVLRTKADDSLSQLFRSNTPEFRQYEDVTARFPSNEFDALVVVSGPQLLERNSIDKLRDAVTDLQLVDGTRALISIFSARQKPQNGLVPNALFPEELPEGAAYDKLIDEVKSNEIIRGKLLSEDDTLTLIVLALDPKIVGSAKLNEVVDNIRKVLKDDLGGTGLRAELSGVPVMQLEIRNAVERDRLVYNTIGFLAGCLIAILFFRRVSFMVVAAGPPLLAILFALGALGWLDFRLNMFLNIMTPLIMVISFSDSMQLTFAARDRLIAGQSKATAFRDAVLVVGPACVLTHATAALSFIALQFTSSDLIRTFGEAGLISTVVALVAVLTLVPLFGVLFVRGEAKLAATPKGSDTGVEALRAFCSFIATKMVARPGLWSVVSIVVVLGLGTVYAQLQPRYRLADQVPDKRQVVAASNQLDAKLTGANPIDILIEFPKGASLYDARTLDVIQGVHNTMAATAGLGNVWSIETLRRWLAENEGKTDAATLKDYVDLLPASLVHRFIDKGEDAVLVSGRIPDVDASRLLPVIDDLNAKLAGIRSANPDYEIAVTGLAAIAARNSSGMIDKLNLGLTVEFLFVAAFIGLAFRSFAVFLVSILPGIFPVVMSGTVLYLMGEGLQFVSVVALTVSFGLGLSATIHFLNRLRAEEQPGEDAADTVMRATILVGPALILTSVVLSCGLAVTVFSDLPQLRLFGWLSAFAMMMALVADLLILRPTATVLLRWFGTQIPKQAETVTPALPARGPRGR